MCAWRGYNKVINSIAEIVGVVKSFAKIIWEKFGTPVEVSRPAPENSLMFFNIFFAFLLTNMEMPSIIYLMFETIIFTVAMGGLYFIIGGGILLWILNYLAESLEELAEANISWREIVVMLCVFFVIGTIFA